MQQVKLIKDTVQKTRQGNVASTGGDSGTNTNFASNISKPSNSSIATSAPATSPASSSSKKRTTSKGGKQQKGAARAAVTVATAASSGPATPEGTSGTGTSGASSCPPAPPAGAVERMCRLACNFVNDRPRPNQRMPAADEQANDPAVNPRSLSNWSTYLTTPHFPYEGDASNFVKDQPYGQIHENIAALNGPSLLDRSQEAVEWCADFDFAEGAVCAQVHVEVPLVKKSAKGQQGGSAHGSTAIVQMSIADYADRLAAEGDGKVFKDGSIGPAINVFLPFSSDSEQILRDAITTCPATVVGQRGLIAHGTSYVIRGQASSNFEMVWESETTAAVNDILEKRARANNYFYAALQGILPGAGGVSRALLVYGPSPPKETKVDSEQDGSQPWYSFGLHSDSPEESFGYYCQHGLSSELFVS